MEVADEELEGIYAWVDEVPLSRPKRNLARDFADGVLVAEVVRHHCPRIVDLHNYSGAHSLDAKLYNWKTLNHKVFKRLGFVVARGECEAVCTGEPGAVERVLKLIKVKLAEQLEPQTPPSTTQRLSPTRSTAQQPVHLKLDAISTKLLATGRTLDIADKPYQRQLFSAGSGSLDPHIERELAYRQQLIDELQESNEALEIRVNKLEQLVQLKNAKLKTLLDRMQVADR
ncbi:hypothetical protein WJX73_004933 [Symbiochloris irregularis]|uniref:Calponin-homology (CH) domain-containing protein n=1 Tax=Symbiochloris irregularis TaxID=706552 RepID=A0AAW1NMB1_9CHLO